MLNMKAKDREKAATWIIGNYDAQINALNVTGNLDYLTFMNVTLFKEVIVHKPFVLNMLLLRCSEQKCRHNRQKRMISLPHRLNKMIETRIVLFSIP